MRLVIPVVPPAGPEGLQLELDDVLIEGVWSDDAEAEATVRDDGTRDDGAITPSDHGIVRPR